MPEGARSRILLVDDDEVDREAVARILGDDDSKFDLTVAESAAAGLAQIENGGWDCVVLDYRFPEGNALELFPNLFHSTCTDRPPVVLLTGLGDERVATDALRSGAQDYLSKRDLTWLTLSTAIGNATASARTTRTQKESVEELRRLSMHDALTGLPNQV